MRIGILTTDEPLYLPAFFDRFLAARARDVVGIFTCAPVYKNQTRSTMFRRYVRTFGWVNTARLSARVLNAKVRDKLKLGFRARLFLSVASAAKYYDVLCSHVDDVNAPEFVERIKSLQTEVILSVSCPQVFRQALISAPTIGCLNLHGANLPAYRGIMPSFWMLANGETQAGVTIFRVNSGIDTGDVVGKRLFPIHPGDTLHSFVIRAKQEACDLALETIGQAQSGRLVCAPLTGEGSYFGWPTREAYLRFRAAGRKLW
jgi:methionyl-tRNA formyltransferase